MNKRLVKILSIALITVILILINHTVLATATGSTLAKKFNGDSAINTTDGETIFQKVIGPVLSVVRIVAIGISVIMITYLGIKYMAAAPSEKANIKSQLITFTIGAIVVVGATTLLDIVKKFADNTIT